ncbi:MAG: transposase [Promethearchaeota archaeon]
MNTINKGTAKPKVQLIYLPPYSPELNEIEQVWRVIKSHVVYNIYYSIYNIAKYLTSRGSVLGLRPILQIFFKLL